MDPKFLGHLMTLPGLTSVSPLVVHQLKLNSLQWVIWMLFQLLLSIQSSGSTTPTLIISTLNGRQWYKHIFSKLTDQWTLLTSSMQKENTIQNTSSMLNSNQQPFLRKMLIKSTIMRWFSIKDLQDLSRTCKPLMLLLSLKDILFRLQTFT